jgi:tetratricopeptide (TPR) repeat protein
MRQAEKAGALVMSARAALRRGQIQETRALLQQALAIQPADLGAIELLGDMFMEEAEQEKAIQVFERGRALHPRHAAFEEKIALCHLDLAEMQRDRDAQQHLLTHGIEKWMERSPKKAVALSLMVPGAGSFYVEENEHGVLFMGAWVLAFIAWYLPLHIGFNSLPEGARHTFGAVLNSLNGFWQGWFWLMLAAFIVVYIMAALDSYQGAQRTNSGRNPLLGM